MSEAVRDPNRLLDLLSERLQLVSALLAFGSRIGCDSLGIFLIPAVSAVKLFWDHSGAEIGRLYL
jgi:hypothetical protein